MPSGTIHFGLFLPFLLFAVAHLCRAQWSVEEQQACVQQCMSTGVNCSSGCGYVDSCAVGWRGIIKRRCYRITYPTMPGYTWAQARTQCQNNGSDLVSIHSEMENSFLYGLIVNTLNPDGKNHNFWTGLQLTRNSAGAVTDANWSDGTATDYGDPVVAPGKYPWAIGEPVNAGNCVRMMGYGPYRGQWYDANCAQATNFVPTSGYFCKGCPAGWTAFNGNCYKAMVDSTRVGVFAHFQRLCSIFNSTIVSIHSAAENNFVLNLVRAVDPNIGTVMIGLRLGWGSFRDYWLDGTPFDFGSSWGAGGWYPWADTGTGYPNQPDQLPPPGDCVMMWVDAAVPANKEPGRWDDISCAASQMSATVCKF